MGPRAAIATSVLLAGCFIKPTPPGNGTTDGGAGSDGSSGPCTSPGPWQPATALAGMNTLDDEVAPWLSPDGRDLWFSRTQPGGGTHSVNRISRASDSGPFDPQTLRVFALGIGGGGPENDARQFLSDDQLTIYWDHMQTSYDTMVATRAHLDDAFGAESYVPVDMDGVLDTYSATVTADHLTMVYIQGSATALDDHFYVTTRAQLSDPWPTGTKQTAATVSGNLQRPALSATGDELYFADTDPSSNHMRLFMSKRTSPTTFGAPTLIAGQPGAGAENTDPMLARDGRTLLFSSGNSATTPSLDLVAMTRSCN